MVTIWWVFNSKKRQGFFLNKEWLVDLYFQRVQKVHVQQSMYSRSQIFSFSIYYLLKFYFIKPTAIVIYFTTLICFLHQIRLIFSEHYAHKRIKKLCILKAMILFYIHISMGTFLTNTLRVRIRTQYSKLPFLKPHLNQILYYMPTSTTTLRVQT